ncbi:hypothetical protein F2Q65_14785 [Thiohalocapsa marina]|uniref:Uncharacterized protein n=1 Tax=Thiohalocapsa marina TaxID=424902 RepID=A0A5M8FH06_9GAMM|nr:hypothetical protein [Thiohalocapsa marina]KAA6183704.1 hypothetical protein F2Q65_14785 [Thiohalocapsa marina]
MRLNREFWNTLDTFLDTASDAELADAKAVIFELMASPSDRESRSLVKAVYRLLIDETRTRQVLARRRRFARPLPALA